MFSNPSEIEAVVELLERRSASLWHACQLQDLDAYLEVGGIPSRSLLEQSRLAFTPFVTDASDRSKGLWSKVFLNLDDFGRSFARGWDATPNPYGPIAIQVGPAALRGAIDVAVCLRSAGASDFDRSGESLSMLEDVDRLFLHPIEAPAFDRMEVRFGEALRGVFAPAHPYATSAEVSLTIEPELVSFRHAIVVWVDPIDVARVPLVELVRRRFLDRGVAVKVRERSIDVLRRTVLAEVITAVGDGLPLLQLLERRADLSEATRTWAAALRSRGLQWQFERWSRYLLEGTLGTHQLPVAHQVPAASSRRASAPGSMVGG